MKLFLLIFMFSINAYSGNWAKESNFKNPNTIWMKEAKCLGSPPVNELCFNLDECEKKDPRRCKILNGKVVNDVIGSAQADSDDTTKQEKQTTRKNRLVTMKGQCAEATGLLKNLCLQATGQ